MTKVKLICRLAFFFTGAFVISGCALTQPASEAIMFRHAHPEENYKRPLLGKEFTPSTHKKPNPYVFQFGVIVTGRPALDKELPYAKRKFHDYLQEQYQKPNVRGEDAVEIQNPHYFSLATSLSVLHNHNVGVNVSAGFPVLGIDATARLHNNTYATLNLGYLAGEFILQQKMVDSSSFGFSLGPYYRAERRGLLVIKGPDESFGLSTLFSLLAPAKTFYNLYMGVRSVLYGHLRGKSYLHAFMASAYVINLKTVAVNAGLGVNFYF